MSTSGIAMQMRWMRGAISVMDALGATVMSLFEFYTHHAAGMTATGDRD